MVRQQVSAAVAAVVAVVAGIWSMVTGAMSTIGLSGTGAAVVSGGLILVGVALLFEKVAYTEGDEDSEFMKYSQLVKAIGITLGISILVVNRDVAMSTAMEFWWILPLGVAGWAMYIYFRYAQNSRSASSALGKTQRQVRRSLSGHVEAATGVVVVGLAVAAALVSGIFNGMSGAGDILLMFAGELSYLAVVAVGYLQLGGSLPFDWLVPSMTARQFLGVSMLLGAIAIMVSQKR